MYQVLMFVHHQIKLLLQCSPEIPDRERKKNVREAFWMTDSMLEEKRGRWVEIETLGWGEGDACTAVSMIRHDGINSKQRK